MSVYSRNRAELASSVKYRSDGRHTGTKVKNIFEVSSNPLQVSKLQAIFETPPRYGKRGFWKDGPFTVHEAAIVLVKYLIQLPEPVVPLELYPAFRDPFNRGIIFDLDEYHAMIRPNQKLTNSLPPVNRQLLLYILGLLAIFAYHSDKNEMTADKLATIFQHGILRHPVHEEGLSQERRNYHVLVFLIENQDYFHVCMAEDDASDDASRQYQ